MRIACSRVCALRGFPPFRDGMRTTPTLQILVSADTAIGRVVAWQLTRLDA